MFFLQLLAPELCEAVIMQLPPRFVYRLMQTNKRFCELCKSEAYWARVALYLIWDPMERSPDDLVLLRTSYGKAMESFLESVRRDASTHTLLRPLSPASFGGRLRRPLEKLLKFAQSILDDGFYGTPNIEGETAFQLVKRILEDVGGLEKSFERSVHAADVIRLPGFITASRRARRARSTFLRSLEDDEGMDFQTKHRVLGYAKKLLGDFTEKRGCFIGTPELRDFELHEECLDIYSVHL